MAQRRPEDGLLHASSDLVSPLRFVQLRAAGAPTVERPIAQNIRLLHGTLWHEWFHNVLDEAGIDFEYEIDLKEYLPDGWGGTADWLFFHPDYDAWVLGDLKTTRGEALYWIDKDGAKKEHIWQLSAYWHALARMGRPLVKGFGIMYWPMNDTSDSVVIEPTIQECDPVPWEIIEPHMIERKALVDDYLDTLWVGKEHFPELPTNYFQHNLAPMPEREQKYYWNKTQQVFDVKLIPSWYERFCDFDEELCPRSSTEKIGHYYLTGEYKPREGREHIAPVVGPTQAEYRKRANG